MGLFVRTIKHKNKTVTRMWYGFILLPTSKRDKNGKRIYERKTFSIASVDKLTKQEAKIEYERIKGIIRAEHADPLVEDPRLHAIIEQYIKHARDVQQKRSWKRDQVALRHFNNAVSPNVLLSSINAHTIDLFKEYRAKMSVSKSTIKRDLEVIRRLFALALKWKKYKGENPVKVAGIDKPRPKPRKVWTDDQQRIIFASDKPEYVRIWKTIRLTGMRAGEVVRLLKRNVDLEKGVIRLTAEDTKEGKSKSIIIGKELKRILSEAMENNDTKFVFLSTKGKPFKSPQGPMRALKKLARQYGLGDIDQHSLRHTFASKLVEIVDINTLRDILGHADVRTTMIYLHSQNESKMRAAEIAEQQLTQIVETKTVTKKKRATRDTA